MRKLWVGLLILAVLTPLGLIIPACLGGGTAWGEWSAEELRELVGFVPAGMRRAHELWRSPAPDYELLPGAAIHTLSVGYVVCALAGGIVTAGAAYLLARLLTKRDGNAGS